MNHTLSKILLILAVTAVFSSCFRNTAINHDDMVQLVAKDDQGNEVIIPSPVKRVIGLAPNLTEFLGILCPDSIIVGRTQNCNYPASVINKTVVNNYPLDYERLISLKPDVVFVMEGMSQPADIERMRKLGLNVYHVKISSFSDIRKTYVALGDLTGNRKKGEQLQNQFDQQLNQLKGKCIRETGDSLSVLALASTSPIYAYGINTLFNEKLEWLGALNAIDVQLESPYPKLDPEYILKQNPDVILGGDFQHMDSTFFAIYPVLKRTTAYKKRQIFKMTDDLMSRQGVRVIESINEIRAALDQCE